MEKFGLFIARNRALVLIIAILLLIPSLYGMSISRVNYDLLTYLPEELDTRKGERIMQDTFSTAATSFLVIEDMPEKDVAKLKDKVADVDGVQEAIWIDDLVDTTIPKEILPDDVKDIFYSENATMIIIKYDEPAASERTMDAIDEVRKLSNKQCFLSGAAPIMRDTKALSDKETPFYVLLAVILAVIVLMLSMESTFVPVVFLLSIGFAIVYNLGTNVLLSFLDNISYVTKALAAVLQLGVTMDYSIFLMHRYDEELSKGQEKNHAMATAIASTFAAITGSSLTTVAGFLALCAMQLGIGKDIGIVMAKGVLLGVLTTITVLPAMILYFDKLIHRFRHGTVLPRFEKSAAFVTKHYKVFVVVFLLAFLPAVYGQQSVDVYYNLDDSLPKDLESVVATNKLKEEFDMTTTHFIIVNDDVPGYKLREMTDRIEKVDGINKVVSYDSIIGEGIPESFVPDDLRDIFKQGGYNLIIANSEYKAARDEENAQIDAVKDIIKEYDKNGIVAGEGPLTKDLIEIAEQDFKHVNSVSIIAIFAIILLVFGSVSIPIILVASIELAIFMNMGIPFYTNTSIPFISSIVVGTIQLGATVDYAILMTTRFKEEMLNGHDKFEAARISVLGSARSIVTSALTFFGATAGVGFISHMEVIKSLCSLISRGAIISMVVIIFILPSLLIAFEGFIAKTTRGWAKHPKVSRPQEATN